MQDKEKARFLYVSGIYKEFGIKPALVYFWIRYHKFPILKIDKKILIPRSDFEAFLESHFIPGA